MFDISIVLSTGGLLAWWRAGKQAGGLGSIATGERLLRDREDPSSPSFSVAVAGLGHPLSAG